MKKLVAVASLAAAALIGGGAGVVAAAASPAPAAPEPASAQAATVSADTATPSGRATDRQGSTGAEAPDPGSSEHQTEADGPGGHQDPAGVTVDHQFNGSE
jgi:hypothetical protein